MKDGPGGSTIQMRVEGAILHANVEADTASHLRAALNSLLRLAAVAEAGLGRR